MVIQPIVDVVNLLFDTIQNSQVLAMLLGIPSIETVQTPHHWATNKSNGNRNPPHGITPNDSRRVRP